MPKICEFDIDQSLVWTLLFVFEYKLLYCYIRFILNLHRQPTHLRSKMGKLAAPRSNQQVFQPNKYLVGYLTHFANPPYAIRASALPTPLSLLTTWWHKSKLLSWLFPLYISGPWSTHSMMSTPMCHLVLKYICMYYRYLESWKDKLLSNPR